MIRFKIIIAIFGLFLIVSTAQAYFLDLPQQYNYRDAILWGNNEGIVEGYPDGTFQHDANINRVEFVKIVMIAKAVQSFYNGLDTGHASTYVADCPTGSEPHFVFSDIHSPQWFDKYVCNAVLEHIVSGYPDGTFRPERPINFAEASKVIAHALLDHDTQLRHDEAWHVQYIQSLSQIGAIPVTSAGPASLVTRGEMMEMIYKVMKYQGMIQEEDVCLAEPIPLAIGRYEYPKKEEYEHLNFFGELFTAAECGTSRVNKLFGIREGNYTLKPDIGIREDASKEFLSLLDEIGFECQQVSEETGQCWHWTLWEIVPVEEILRLKPYADEIVSDGCINCG